MPEALDVAPQVQPGPAPVARRQQRCLDGGQVGVAGHVGRAVLLGRQRHLPGGFAVLPGHIARPPADEAAGEHPAVALDVPVRVDRALPGHDGGQRRRPQRRHPPGVDGEVGDAHDRHPAGAPRLVRGPLDAVVEVLRLAPAQHRAPPRRVTRAPGVDPHHRVALRHPPLGVDGLPVHEAALLGHGLVHRGSAGVVPEVDVLGVGAERDDDRGGPPVVGPEHVGHQLGGVPDRDGGVAFGQHAGERRGRSCGHGPIPPSPPGESYGPPGGVRVARCFMDEVGKLRRRGSACPTTWSYRPTVTPVRRPRSTGTTSIPSSGRRSTPTRPSWLRAGRTTPRSSRSGTRRPVTAS